MRTNHRRLAATAKRAALTTLGQKLRNAREHAEHTQQTVADNLAVVVQTVRNWETGNMSLTKRQPSLWPPSTAYIPTNSPLIPRHTPPINFHPAPTNGSTLITNS